MRPTERAMARVDPEFIDLGLTDEGNIGGRGGAQAAPVLRIAALGGRSRVGHAGQQDFNAL